MRPTESNTPRPVGKAYLYRIEYDRGSAEINRGENTFTDPLHIPLIRALIIPGHRIVIEAHEDPADPCETGAATRRLEVLRQLFIAECIKEDRLELKIHAKTCCRSSLDQDWCRRSDIHLFPSVASLFPEVGGHLLSLREYYGLELARDATWDKFKEDDPTGSMLEIKFTNIEWRRILGHETLRAWLEAGAHHPFLVSAGLNIGPKYR